MSIVVGWTPHTKVFVLPIKIQTKRDVMQETFSLFHSRDTATDRPVTRTGKGVGGWHLLNCQAAITPYFRHPEAPQQRHQLVTHTFVFLQNVLICLEVFLFVRERICLRRVLSHNPSPSDWTFTSGGQWHGLRVSVCVRVHVFVYICVCVLRSQEWSALLLRWRKRPRSRPCLAPWPIGSTSSDRIDWKNCTAKKGCLYKASDILTIILCNYSTLQQE